MFHRFSSISYFRNFIFGVEDSLVSTVGLLSGVAVANVPMTTILLTGLILIFVEAISMAAGSFLSEYSAEGYASHSERPTRSNFISGLIMFFSYFVSGFIPLSPYLFWPVDSALWISVSFSVGALFILGVVGAKISRINMFKNGFRMAIVGGIAIVVGMLAGNLLSKL
ncbi:MAG: hypothetical protein A3B86_04675 [Candidatus Yanofskybacteria bacterium RIFCSPHIGHO2_02_FULL_38_22b]|uniref:VIT family protein n=1 Tax=Candidatus Yanofskybacteria bacterium RIFCSPHIGHO2_02_FULL_38_22b TaxID=1802673 RepID=A0A1F8F302_9BACT|nr:MAG: hypothetical protein A2816_01150 [Candidatus Yanofskybacteria bacterium RIFCSPHIGHO2_01_FULL_39_44]OGN07507.1 MAG: hypothetical protein A3B86_04675 [Candidatus Yanofskybacteria bacterium RIFCSPHIGHO2_02_FULL_38_22b]